MVITELRNASCCNCRTTCKQICIHQWCALCVKRFPCLQMGRGHVDTNLATWWNSSSQRLPLVYLWYRSLRAYGLKCCCKFNQRSPAFFFISIFPSFFFFLFLYMMNCRRCWLSGNLEHISCSVSIYVLTGDLMTLLHLWELKMIFLFFFCACSCGFLFPVGIQRGGSGLS